MFFGLGLGPLSLERRPRVRKFRGIRSDFSSLSTLFRLNPRIDPITSSSPMVSWGKVPLSNVTIWQFERKHPVSNRVGHYQFLQECKLALA